MASRSDFYRTISAVALGVYSCKSVISSSALPAFISNDKLNKLAGQKKATLALNGANASAAAVFIYFFKYNEADLLRILKIFLEIKG